MLPQRHVLGHPEYDYHEIDKHHSVAQLIYGNSGVNSFRVNVAEDLLQPFTATEHMKRGIAENLALVVTEGTPVQVAINYSLDARDIKVEGFSVKTWPHDGDYVIASLYRDGAVVAEHRLSGRQLSGEGKKIGRLDMSLNGLSPGFYQVQIKLFCRDTARAEVCSTTIPGLPICISEEEDRPAVADVEVYVSNDKVFDFLIEGSTGWRIFAYLVEIK